MMLMINLFLSIMFLFMNHPLTMGFLLLIQTILISMITGMLNSNFWFSYILFLIMIGGMLVLFIYMTSIASNEMFSYSNPMMILSYSLMISLTIIYLMMDLYFYNMNFTFLETLENKNMNYSLTKYFNYPSMLMMFFMIIYLFITLVAVVKITKIEYGPLRQLY